MRHSTCRSSLSPTALLSASHNIKCPLCTQNVCLGGISSTCDESTTQAMTWSKYRVLWWSTVQLLQVTSTPLCMSLSWGHTYNGCDFFMGAVAIISLCHRASGCGYWNTERSHTIHQA